MQLRENTELQCGKYRIVRVLGQGGFGITYLAEHTMLDKMVAIKEFFPKEYCDRDETTSHITIGTKNSVDLVAQLKTKFIKEAKNISKLHHPNIITIHDIFQENDTAYYVMEYVEGISLAGKIKDDGALSETEAIGYIRKVADAVGYMHSLSMNHLDLKPANIMVRIADNEPVLIDFGLSKQYDASGSQTSTTPIGISHGYAPIEQYLPEGVSSFSPQTDIYALGATLFAMITGKTPPHYGEILENGIPDYNSEIEPCIKSAIEHALETKKQKRPQTIDEFLAHFNDIDEHIVNTPTSKSANPIPDNSVEVIISKEIDNVLDEGKEEVDKKQDSLEGQYMSETSEENTLLVTPIAATNQSETSKDIEKKQPEPKITISKRWGVSHLSRAEYVEVSWVISDAKLAYIISGGSSKEIPLTGSTVITEAWKHIKIRAIGENDIISESGDIRFY